jgi:hypothetical protein
VSTCRAEIEVPGWVDEEKKYGEGGGVGDEGTVAEEGEDEGEDEGGEGSEGIGGSGVANLWHGRRAAAEVSSISTSEPCFILHATWLLRVGHRLLSSFFPSLTNISSSTIFSTASRFVRKSVGALISSDDPQT